MLIFHAQGGYFDTISKVVQESLKEPFVISSNPNDVGTWVLFFTSFLSGFHKKIKSPYILIQTELLDNTIIRYPEYKSLHDNALKVLDIFKNFQLRYSDVYRIDCEQSKEIDVLFYGSMSGRRKKILDEINCNKKILDKSPPISGPELWKYINNSKIILNISCGDNRYYPDWVRISPLLSNKIFIITESVGDESFNLLKSNIQICEYNDIPSKVDFFLKNPIERILWADKGFNYITKHETKITQ